MLHKPGETSAASISASDRRAERRHRGKGSLKLSFDDPAHQEISGRLLDYSQNGFRAFHSYPALLTGQVVQFRHALEAGQARVMWNRIADECVETGFLVIK
ncbi:MAG TPA: PilZ domain-containing protein [Bryobacteraceae bacterium]|jgi:hypothetical protein|nr:PilZ domain-containing protein [Bryobacteraceae bacterium]